MIFFNWNSLHGRLNSHNKVWSYKKKDLPETIYIGSCNQHILHGAFQTAIPTSVKNIDKILKSVYWILHNSPARREIYCREGGRDVFP